MSISDQHIRDELKNPSSLGDNLLLEASAGTGKTTTLINRVLALIKDGVPISEIAIITFTRNATAELRHRIRRELSAEIAGLGQSTKTEAEKSKEKTQLQNAFLDLDKARIDTIHSFCKKILDEFPIEAGLPHRFSVMDEIQAELEMNKRWETDFLPRMVGTPLDESRKISTNHRMAFSLAQVLDIDFELGGKLYQMAREAERYWWVLPNPQEIAATDDPDFWKNLLPRPGTAVMDGIRTIEFTGRAQKEQQAKFCRELDQLQSEFNSLSDFEQLRGFLRVARLAPNSKAAPNKFALDPVREAAKKISSKILSFLLAELCAFTARGAETRSRNSQATYEDLLVRVLRLLRDPQMGEGIRSLLYPQYKRILIDEFQDTDPLQFDIARLITTSPKNHIPERGSIFLVGDEKQSIYHFRGADLRAFNEAKQAKYGDEKLFTKKELSINFRTIEPIIKFVNKAFGSDPMFGATYQKLDAYRTDSLPEDFGPPVYLGEECPKEKSADSIREFEARQIAKYIIWMLDAKRGWKVLDKEAKNDEEAKNWRRAELADICILVPSKTGIKFYTSALEEAGIPYRLELGGFIFADPAIQDLVNTLRAIENPRDELALIRALRSPLFGCSDNDLYGFNKHSKGWDYLEKTYEKCSPDDDIVHQGIVHQGLAWFQKIHLKKGQLAASQIIELIISKRLALEISGAHTSQSNLLDFATTLDFFLEKVRDFSKNSSGSLEELIAWVDSQIANESRWTLPKANDWSPAVKIMTMHSAKGLEFPIVVLAGMDSGGRGMSQSGLAFDSSGELFFSLGEDSAPLKMDLALPSYPKGKSFREGYREQEKKELAEERKRLLYVACTRARDHLVIATPAENPATITSEEEPSKPKKKAKKEKAKVLSPADQMRWAIRTGYGVPVLHPEAKGYNSINDVRMPLDLPSQLSGSAVEREYVDIPDLKTWAAERERILTEARAKGVRSATDIQRAARKESLGIVEEAEAEDKTEAGLRFNKTAKNKGLDIGNAVHHTLKDLNFALRGIEQEERLQELAKEYGEEYAIENPQKIVDTCRQILKSKSIARALELSEGEATRESQANGDRAIIKKEIRFQTQLSSDKRFDGFVDLLLYDPQAHRPQAADKKVKYTILDYKYSNKLDAKTLDARMDAYKFQGASYALGLIHILGLTHILKGPADDLPDVVFVFANAKEAIERSLEPEELRETIQAIQTQ